MSEFFSQLGSNIRFPDANINGGGPLPTSLSGPAGINGDPDGRINFNSELLSGIQPYAFGPGRMGSDRSYQQIPHRIQKIIPKLYLPYADLANNRSTLELSHAVDQGDIAFVLQSNRVQSLVYNNSAMMDAAISNQQLPAHSAFVNISTVNYILAGLQRLSAASANNLTWSVLARDLGFSYKDEHSRMQILRLVSTRLVPFGICVGSENQGGQHETGLAPVQAAVNHVTTMTVDGQSRDLVNFWRQVDISAGDELIYKLAWLPTQHYTLNHYYKGTVRQSFVQARCCWQLVPDKFDMSHVPKPPRDCPWEYDYRVHGYWRVAQTFQHRAKYEAEFTDVANDLSFLRGQLLQVTFAPVWVQFEPFTKTDPPPAAPAHAVIPLLASHSTDNAPQKRSFLAAFADRNSASKAPVLLFKAPRISTPFGLQGWKLGLDLAPRTGLDVAATPLVAETPLVATPSVPAPATEALPPAPHAAAATHAPAVQSTANRADAPPLERPPVPARTPQNTFPQRTTVPLVSMSDIGRGIRALSETDTPADKNEERDTKVRKVLNKGGRRPKSTDTALPDPDTME